jgi:DNA-binding beta-propeller fold protein YncE
MLFGSRVVGTIAVGAGPAEIGVNPVSGLVYVANRLSQSISIISDISPFKVFLPVALKNR